MYTYTFGHLLLVRTLKGTRKRQPGETSNWSTEDKGRFRGKSLWRRLENSRCLALTGFYSSQSEVQGLPAGPEMAPGGSPRKYAQ